MEFTPKNRATVQNMPKLPYAVGSTEPSARQCELSWKQSEKNHGDIQRSG